MTRLAALLALAACAAPPAPDPRLAAQLEQAARLKATEQRLDRDLLRVELVYERLEVHSWTTTEQPDGPVTFCLHCGARKLK